MRMSEAGLVQDLPFADEKGLSTCSGGPPAEPRGELTSPQEEHVDLLCRRVNLGQMNELLRSFKNASPEKL